MKKILVITLLWTVAGCNMEYIQRENDLEGYHWLGVAVNEEIRNDTIYTYANKIGDDDFTYCLIKEITDSTITYHYQDKVTGHFSEYTAPYSQKLMDDNPYLIIYRESSVSMFTRKRVCPIKFN